MESGRHRRSLAGNSENIDGGASQILYYFRGYALGGNFAFNYKRSFLVKKSMLFLLAALIAAMPVATRAGIKYVAVVETEVDPNSGASADLTRAEVSLITAELRREAVNNLPRNAFSVMTSETVQSMGGAVLDECSEENCVITLGSKIGADYIVRGIISKFRARFTLSVEIYETDNGTLLASSDPVRCENVDELIEKAGIASADMYKKFVNAQTAAPGPTTARPAPEPQQPPPPATYTVSVSVAANPTKGGYVSRNPDQKTYALGTIVSVTAVPANGYMFTGWTGSSNATKETLTAPIDRDLTLMANFSKRPKQETEIEPPAERGPTTGFMLGFSFLPSDDGHYAGQLGIAHSRPILDKNLSLNAEGNILIGEDGNYSFDFFGFNVPLTAMYQLSFFSLEAGVDMDLIFGGEETLFNAGYVIGAGIGFSKKRARRYFYRYCGGYNFGTHVIGWRWMF